MATRNTIYVIRVGTDTPQRDGYTYLRLKAMCARGYTSPVRVVPAGGAPTGFCPEKILGKI
jgi:hypothetical protein